MSVTVLYFASLRDAAGRESESVDAPGDLASLYDRLREKHRFALPRERVRVAVNGAFAQWGDAPRDGDEVALLPPVSGG